MKGQLPDLLAVCGTPKQLRNPDNVTADENGTGVDCSTYDGPMYCILSINREGTDSDETCDVKLQSSATLGGTYADITGAAFTQVTTVDGIQMIRVNRDNVFVRHVIDTGGTTPDYVISIVLLGQLKQG